MLIFLLFGGLSFAGPADLWPAAIKVAEVEKQRSALDSTPLPPELKPAVQFQKTFLKMIAAKDAKEISTEAVQDLKAFVAADKESDPVAHGVAEVARVWLAYVQMQQIDAVLRQYYRKNVRFPDSIMAVEAVLPEEIRRDPWGQPWVYQLCAPIGFSKLTGQRYFLQSSNAFVFGTLEGNLEGIRNTGPLAPFNIKLLEIAGRKALEVRINDDGPPRVYTIQGGGMLTEHIRLLYIGENWALLAWPYQLFAITF